MGRKIPAKKHRGVKDPLKQQAQRIKSLKGKINAPPKDPDEQPVPKSLIELFSFQSKEKNDEKKKRKMKHNEHVSDGDGGKNPITRMRKLQGESQRAFSLRINSAVKALHDPIDNEDYPQDLEEDDYKGERMQAQRERRERKRKKAERAARAKGEPIPGNTTKLTRTQKYALKKMEKKNKIIEAQQERSLSRYEHVAFGEVAHAPPALTVKPRRANGADGAPRPGRRDLLLSKLLSGTSTVSSSGSSHGSVGMRSTAPLADKLRRERDRLQAVQAYRALKANKLPDKKPTVLL